MYVPEPKAQAAQSHHKGPANSSSRRSLSQQLLRPSRHPHERHERSVVALAESATQRRRSASARVLRHVAYKHEPERGACEGILTL